MKSRIPWRAGCLAVGLMACDGIQAQQVPSATPGFPSPLGGSAPSLSVTNSQRVTRKDGLRYLEEELTKSLQFLTGRRALEGVLAPEPLQAPPPRAVIPSRRSKDNSNSRGLWGSLTGSDDESDASEDLFNLPGNSGADGKQTTIEDYYDRLNLDRASARTPGFQRSDAVGTQRYSRDRSDNVDSRNDGQLPSTIREKARTLRERFLGNDPSDRIFDPRGESEIMSGVFRPSDRGAGLDQFQSHQDYLERYRQVLSSSSPGSGALPNLVPTPSTAAPSQPLGLGGVDSFASSARRDFSAAQPAALGSILRPAAVPDVDRTVLNQWNPLYQAPQAGPSKPISIQSPPFMEAPRRRF